MIKPSSDLDLISGAVLQAKSALYKGDSYRHGSEIESMTTAGATPQSEYSCATESRRTFKDLREKRKGQPVYVLGHDEQFKGQEGVFETFNVRLAVVKFPNGKTVGFDPLDLLLPCEIHENGEAYFEIRFCDQCDQMFPLTAHEFWAEQEPTTCPECAL